MGRTVALVGALAVMLVLVLPAGAAAPNYILVSGPGLKRPVLLANWGENGLLLSALVRSPRAETSVVRGLARRARLDLAEFWGWGKLPQPTRPSEANQHGWFYPAHRREPAVFDLMINGIRTPRVAPALALSILVRHGVPIRLR